MALGREEYIQQSLVPDPTHPEVEIAAAKLKTYRLPGSDQITTEPFQTRGEILQPDIHILINSIWDQDELPGQWKEFIIVPIYKKV
jgi:hypothetical protein